MAILIERASMCCCGYVVCFLCMSFCFLVEIRLCVLEWCFVVFSVCVCVCVCFVVALVVLVLFQRVYLLVVGVYLVYRSAFDAHEQDTSGSGGSENKMNALMDLAVSWSINVLERSGFASCSRVSLP